MILRPAVFAIYGCFMSSFEEHDLALCGLVPDVTGNKAQESKWEVDLSLVMLVMFMSIVCVSG